MQRESQLGSFVCCLRETPRESPIDLGEVEDHNIDDSGYFTSGSLGSLEKLSFLDTGLGVQGLLHLDIIFHVPCLSWHVNLGNFLFSEHNSSTRGPFLLHPGTFMRVRPCRQVTNRVPAGPDHAFMNYPTLRRWPNRLRCSRAFVFIRVSCFTA